MTQKRRKPAWWMLYILVFLMIAALVLESQDGLPDWANGFAAIGIIVAVFAAMGIWLHVNMPALWNEELSKPGEEEYHIEVYEPRRSSNLLDETDRDGLDTKSKPTHLVLTRSEKGTSYAFRISPGDRGTAGVDSHHRRDLSAGSYGYRADRFPESSER